ncbi:MAG: hypothetical protein ACRDKI_00405 [Solirubrobacterales bacterium]
MTWVLVAFDDDTLAAVLDDARIRSLDSTSDFVLLTPNVSRWGDERSIDGDGYLETLDKRVDALRGEGVALEHEWLPGDDLETEIVESGRSHSAEGVVIAHHNPNDAIPDPTAFDDAIRDELGVPLDVISLE